MGSLQVLLPDCQNELRYHVYVQGTEAMPIIFIRRGRISLVVGTALHKGCSLTAGQAKQGLKWFSSAPMHVNYKEIKVVQHSVAKW